LKISKDNITKNTIMMINRWKEKLTLRKTKRTWKIKTVKFVESHNFLIGQNKKYKVILFLIQGLNGFIPDGS
jgi:hypothetical protein